VDLLYSQEGYKTANEEVKLNYLQIPIYYDLFFGELGEAFRPKIYVGIVPGFFLDGKINGGESNKDFYNSFVVAASGGLGFNYRVGNRMWLNADLRAYWGLSDLRADKGVDPDVIAGKTIQPSIGLAYGLGKL
jgi:outer membrane protein W